MTHGLPRAPHEPQTPREYVQRLEQLHRDALAAVAFTATIIARRERASRKADAYRRTLSRLQMCLGYLESAAHAAREATP